MWQKAENRKDCALLVFADAGREPRVRLRRAVFSGGWAVAYDTPAVRSAFGADSNLVGNGRAHAPVCPLRNSGLANRWPEWTIFTGMTALPDLVLRFDSAAGARVGLLALAVVCASASGAGPSWAKDLTDARAYVDAHNAIRAAVQKPAGYAGDWEPLPPVTWSDEVASSAQVWAEHLRDTMHCGLSHSDTRYGENLAAGKKVDAEKAVRMWAGEISKYRYVPKYEFETNSGHYTQLIWRKTTQIGCGRATCGRNAVVVCRYSPPGNHIGKAPY